MSSSMPQTLGRLRPQRNLIEESCTIHGVKLSAFDLNHVRALHFLLEEAHVARAARRLSITPAAASNALQRLRSELGDPLLVRFGRTFARTALAEELRGPAREVINAAQRLLDAAVPFDPATYDGLFVVEASDRIIEVLLGPVDALLCQRAPRARLLVRTLGGPVPGVRPEQQSLLIAPAGAHRLNCEPLFTEPYVCVMRAGNPLLRRKFTLERYAGADHILVSPRGESDRGIVDDVLAEHGLTRRVSRLVTSSTLALTLVKNSDRITTLPASFSVVRGPGQGLIFHPLPLTLAPIRMQLAWHPQQDGDPRYVWFRGLVHEVVRSLGLHP
jgi:DNA-binding transcriptional LysR family regulator